MSDPLLVLVHPGSACGSADFNIGKFEARAARSGLTNELDTWDGGVVVVDGSLSDELGGYPMYDAAIKKALSRAKANGLPSVRVFACDDVTDGWIEVACDAVSRVSPDHSTPIVATGAWASNDEDTGCVNAVQEELRRRGYKDVQIGNAVFEFELKDTDEIFEYLAEKIEVVEVDGNDVRVAFNPGIAELRAVLNKAEGDARGYVSKDGQVIFWDAGLAIHSQMAAVVFYELNHYNEFVSTTLDPRLTIKIDRYDPDWLKLDGSLSVIVCSKYLMSLFSKGDVLIYVDGAGWIDYQEYLSLKDSDRVFAEGTLSKNDGRILVFGIGRPRCLIVAGQHGDEPLGTELARRLAEELDGVDLKGQVLIIPIASPPARTSGTRHGHGVDMNRAFESVAAVVDEIMALAEDMDLVVDVHSTPSSAMGDAPLIIADPPELAKYFGCGVCSNPAPVGSLRGYCSKIGVPVVLFEASDGPESERSIDVGVLGIVDMLEGEGFV